MIHGLKLTKGQYSYFASALKTLGEGTILGSSAAFFLPEALQLNRHISIERYFILFLIGLILLIVGGILYTQGDRK